MSKSICSACHWGTVEAKGEVSNRDPAFSQCFALILVFFEVPIHYTAFSLLDFVLKVTISLNLPQFCLDLLFCM